MLILEPLRKLTNKNAVFKWGQAEQDSFVQLKKCLSNAKTLGYYDKNAETQVIADASPAGPAGCSTNIEARGRL